MRCSARRSHCAASSGRWKVARLKKIRYQRPLHSQNFRGSVRLGLWLKFRRKMPNRELRHPETVLYLEW